MICSCCGAEDVPVVRVPSVPLCEECLRKEHICPLCGCETQHTPQYAKTHRWCGRCRVYVVP